MKTLVAADEPPERHEGPRVTYTDASGNTTTVNASWVGIVRLEDVPDGPIRTQAFVNKHKEIGQ